MLARSMKINLHQKNFTALQYYLDWRPKFVKPWFWSKIRSLWKRPLSSLKRQNAFLKCQTVMKCVNAVYSRCGEFCSGAHKIQPQPGICEFEVIVLNMDIGTVNDNKFASTKFHCPPILLFRLEAKVCETLVLKQNQVFVKTASKQPQETKCIFNRIFEWK